jgi:hypothetical protein
MRAVVGTDAIRNLGLVLGQMPSGIWDWCWGTCLQEFGIGVRTDAFRNLGLMLGEMASGYLD